MGNNPRVFWKDGEYIEDTKENRQAIRITELEQQLNEAKAGWDSAIADLYAAAEIAKGMQSQLADERLAFEHANEVIGKLEADIAALSWTQIAPENLPKVGDEVKYVKIAGKFNVGKMRVEIVEADWKEGWLQRSDAIVWAEYRRPLNPPPRALEPQ